MSNILTVVLSGQLPRVSAFLDGFKEDDISLDVKKDLTQGDLEEYEVNITYDPDKVEDPVIVLKKHLPDNIDLVKTLSQSQYYGMNEDIVNLKDSIPNYLSFDYYPDKLKILGSDLYSAVHTVKEKRDFDTSSIYVKSFVDLALRLLTDDLDYTWYSMKNERDMLNLYTMSCQDLMREDNKDALNSLNLLNIALNAVFHSVQMGKVKLSEKIGNPSQIKIRQYLKNAQYDFNKVILANRVEVSRDTFPRSTYFIKEVNKYLDGISDRGPEYMESLYYDALNELYMNSDDQMTSDVDQMWELYRYGKE